MCFPRFIAAPSSSDLGRWRDRRSVLAWRASPRHTRGRAARPSRTGAFDSDCRRRTRATRADATGVSSTLASARASRCEIAPEATPRSVRGARPRTTRPARRWRTSRAADPSANARGGRTTVAGTLRCVLVPSRARTARRRPHPPPARLGFSVRASPASRPVPHSRRLLEDARADRAPSPLASVTSSSRPFAQTFARHASRRPGVGQGGGLPWWPAAVQDPCENTPRSPRAQRGEGTARRRSIPSDARPRRASHVQGYGFRNAPRGEVHGR